jgi:hypothetical protein
VGRAGLVARTALVDRLLSTEAQIVSVVAPPGIVVVSARGEAVLRAEEIGLLSR